MLHHLYLGYVKFHFHTKKNLQRGQGGLMKINHKLYAVYLDKQGIYHYFSPYCPHLKGLLSFDEKIKYGIVPVINLFLIVMENLLKGLV